MRTTLCVEYKKIEVKQFWYISFNYKTWSLEDFINQEGDLQMKNIWSIQYISRTKRRIAHYLQIWTGDYKRMRVPTYSYKNFIAWNILVTLHRINKQDVPILFFIFIYIFFQFNAEFWSAVVWMNVWMDGYMESVCMDRLMYKWMDGWKRVDEVTSCLQGNGVQINPCQIDFQGFFD